MLRCLLDLETGLDDLRGQSQPRAVVLAENK